MWATHHLRRAIYTDRAVGRESNETIDTIVAGIASYQASNWLAFYDGTSNASIARRPLALHTRTNERMHLNICPLHAFA